MRESKEDTLNKLRNEYKRYDIDDFQVRKITADNVLSNDILEVWE